MSDRERLILLIRAPCISRVSLLVHSASAVQDRALRIQLLRDRTLRGWGRCTATGGGGKAREGRVRSMLREAVGCPLAPLALAHRRSSALIGRSAAMLAYDWPGRVGRAPPLGALEARPASGRRRVRPRLVRLPQPGVCAGSRRSGRERGRCRPLQVTPAR